MWKQSFTVAYDKVSLKSAWVYFNNTIVVSRRLKNTWVAKKKITNILKNM